MPSLREMSTSRETPRSRILLTGLPATGKTTLAAALADHLGLPRIDEAASDLAAVGVDVGPNSRWETLAAIAAIQQEREHAAAAFVADRGPFDMLAYACARLFRQPDEVGHLVAPAVIRLSNRWLATAHYDLVIYHSEPCGERGRHLLEREGAFLHDLRSAFESSLADCGFPVVQVEAKSSTAERLEAALSALPT